MGSISAFVYLTSIIVVMGSERVYWYWAGLTAGSVLEMAAFYVVPVAVAVWILALVPARRFHQVVLGGAVFAFVVEGVLTPIIYADGPLPVLASLFVGWHGMVAFVGMWYLTRRWLLAGYTHLVMRASSAFGTLWGVWAFVAAFGDPELPGGTGDVLSPGQFTVYALGVGVVFVAAHWLIGFVWPEEWKPGRASTWIVGIVAVTYFAVAVLFAVPWAPAKLGILLGGTYWLMCRAPDGVQANGPTVLDRLSGTISLTSTAPILVAPLMASIAYGAMWLIDAPDAALGGLYWVFVAAQIVGGGIAYTWAARRSLMARSHERDTVRVLARG